MIDGVAMRMIQTEGEENQYYMDPQSRIYDRQANSIGKVNSHLEVLGYDHIESYENPLEQKRNNM